MAKEKIELYKLLKKNRTTTLAALAVSGIVCLASLFMVYTMQKNSNRYVYGISDTKELMPLELIEKEELVETFRKGHIMLWMDYFYNVDQYNYLKQVEKSFWLIDQTGQKLYKQYQQSGYFNTMIRTSSSQYVEDVKIIFGKNDAFQITAIINIDMPNQEDTRVYELVGQGKIAKVKENYPKNPYGYIITDYREVSKNQIQ